MGEGVAAVGPARRLSGTVFIGVAFGMVALYAAFTAAPLVAEDLTGTRAWSGLPGAAAIAGTSLGTALLSALMATRGRRPGLVVGWATGIVGAVLALAAIAEGSFVLFVLAMLVLGIGHGANQLARFAAADPHPLDRRGTVLSLVVWAGTVGAIVGPNLLDPIGSVAGGLGMAPLAGGYLAAGTAFGVAALVVMLGLRPDPSSLAVDRGGHGRRTTGGWSRDVVVAVAALIAAQFVMLLIMTMTPVHIRGHEHGLAAVGGVMSVHFAGMFALAPVAGKASDRFGGLRVALVGLGLVTAAGLLAAIAPMASVATLTVALLLLGLGWSAAFVASSSLLAAAGPVVQGRADAVGWGFAALASIASGFLIASVGYTAMCLVGAGLAAGAALRVLREIRRPTAEPRMAPATP